MKVSFECEKLINELKKDIAEFGDIELYAFFEKVNECVFLTNYDFIDEEHPLTVKELKEDTIVRIMKASEILKILEKQNSIL